MFLRIAGVQSTEQSGIKGAKCFLPQHLLPNIVNASQFQTVRKLLFYLVLPLRTLTQMEE